MDCSSGLKNLVAKDNKRSLLGWREGIKKKSHESIAQCAIRREAGNLFYI